MGLRGEMATAKRRGLRSGLRDLLHALRPRPAGARRKPDDPPEPPAARAGRPVLPRRPDPTRRASAALEAPAADPPLMDAIGRPLRDEGPAADAGP
jgi:hypothetical protein